MNLGFKVLHVLKNCKMGRPSGFYMISAHNSQYTFIALLIIDGIQSDIQGLTHCTDCTIHPIE